MGDIVHLYENPLNVIDCLEEIKTEINHITVIIELEDKSLTVLTDSDAELPLHTIVLQREAINSLEPG